MKKQILMAIILTLACNNIFADRGNVTLHNDDAIIRSTKGKSEVPIVNYNDGKVTITAENLIGDARIVIFDAEGNVITETDVVLSASENTISIPDESTENGCTIHVEYDGSTYYGFLN